MSIQTPTMFVRAACALAVLSGAGTAFASVLTGSGPNLPIPIPNPASFPHIGAVNSGITTAGFTGTWTAPAEPDWIGSFDAKGPVPSGSSSPAGTTRYDFTTLAHGSLPAGTFFWIGDVDHGSGAHEYYTFNAYDSSGAVITSPWLDEPIQAYGTGLTSTAMPSWDWDSGTGTYTFDGMDVPFNPSIGIYMPSNQDISTLVVFRSAAVENFALHAPTVPAPGSAALVALSGLVVLRRRR